MPQLHLHDSAILISNNNDSNDDNNYSNSNINNSKHTKCKHWQVAQLSQRDRAAGWVSYDQKWKTETGRQYFTDIKSLRSTTVT